MKAKAQTCRSHTKAQSGQAGEVSNFRFDMRGISLAGLALMLGLFISAEAGAQSAVDGFGSGADAAPLVLAVQADGKILVGGGFTTLIANNFVNWPRNRIGRLNPDGKVDADFDPGANASVFALAVQPDGKILVGGDFTLLGGGTRNRIARLNPDGSLDAGFNPGANGIITTLALQADGKILVGGEFTGLGGGAGTTTRHNLGRLNADGTVDASFNPGANTLVYALAVQRSGKVVVGGTFTTLGGGGMGTTTRNNIGRLNPDGSLDASFNPGANGYVSALAVQADDRIVAGGGFTTLGGGGAGMTARSRIGRLNADGSLDAAFNPGANNGINALSVQADGRILLGGGFTTLGGVTRNKVGRLMPDGTLDTSFDPGANAVVYALAEQADGKILAAGSFTTLGGGGTGTTACSKIGRLHSNGTVDVALDNTLNADPGDFVLAFALQPDGKILVGGRFTFIGGGARYDLARLHPNGTLDADFSANTSGGVGALAVQADGKILLGGGFEFIHAATRHRIARLNPNGTLDTSFNPGANHSVTAFAVQADGKILIGGNFTTLGGGGTGTTPRNFLGRLNPDGSLDTSFDPSANGAVETIIVQPDGKILIGGYFTTLGSGTSTTTRNRIARLNSDGTVDTTFIDAGVDGGVRTLAVQSDGKIVAGGSFTTLAGMTRNNIGRVNPDGTVDATFNPGANQSVTTLAVQADGKILAGGYFTFLGPGGTARDRIARLYPDGNIDTSFNPGANQLVQALAVQADGKILVGGYFSELAGRERFRIGRLTNPVAALQSVDVSTNGTTIDWPRSGASPEVHRVTFELSTDATNYTPLPNPTRISGGWQLTGQSLPTQQNIFIRARGFYGTGASSGSGSVVETVRNAFISASLLPTSVGSQKTHGAAGSFDIDLPLTGSPGIECRSGGINGNHTLIFTFPNPLVSVAGASVTSGVGSVSGSAIGTDAHDYVVNITGVANAQEIMVTLTDVNDALGNTSASVPVTMGVLVGDTNGNRIVNASDLGQTKAQSGQPLTPSNFRTDANVSGSITASDIGLVKFMSGTQLP